MQTQQKKKSKRRDVFKKTTTNYDVPSRCHYVIEGLFNINPSFAPLLCALCSVAKFCLFYDWLQFDSNLGWAAKHGDQWCHLATTLMKPGACSASSALCSWPAVIISRKSSSVYTDLVSQQETRDERAVSQLALAVQVFFPTNSILVGGFLGQVKHDDASVGILVVHSCHGGEALLTWNQLHG